MFCLESARNLVQVPFLKGSFQNEVFNSSYFKCFTTIVDHLFPNWLIFRHLLPVFNIYTKCTKIAFDDIVKTFIKFMSPTFYHVVTP